MKWTVVFFDADLLYGGLKNMCHRDATDLHVWFHVFFSYYKIIFVNTKENTKTYFFSWKTQVVVFETNFDFLLI